MKPTPTPSGEGVEIRYANNRDDDEGEAAEIEADFAALESMDIDRDFNVWEDFRASISLGSMSAASAGSGGRDGLTKSERDDLAKWKSRWTMQELYSRHYRPVPRERKEVEDLASFLGVADSSSSLKSSKRPAVDRLFYPTANEPKSVLLMRGPVLLRGEGERELILLTRGVVVAAVAPPAPPTSKSSPPLASPEAIGRAMEKTARGVGKLALRSLPVALAGKVIRRKFETCSMLSSVLEAREDGRSDGLGGEASFVVDFDNGAMWTFSCATTEHRDAWVEALMIAVRHARTNGEGGLSSKGGSGDVASELFGTQRVGRPTNRTSPNSVGGKGVANGMSEAVSALRERGERIERLDQKTAQLQSDASEYKGLAKQLKEKTKKKNNLFGL